MAFYDEPFKRTDYIGNVAWDELCYFGSVFHACSLEDAKAHVAAGRVPPSRAVSWFKKDGTVGTFHGFWATLNYYNDGFEFGPALFTWNADQLQGKHFSCFARLNGARRRIVMVEIEKTSNRADFAQWFIRQDDGQNSRRGDTIYNLVLRRELSTSSATLQGVRHKNGLSESDAKAAVCELAAAQLNEWLRLNPEFQSLVQRFPDLAACELSIARGHRKLPPAIELDDLFDLDTQS